MSSHLVYIYFWSQKASLLKLVVFLTYLLCQLSDLLVEFSIRLLLCSAYRCVFLIFIVDFSIVSSDLTVRLLLVDLILVFIIVLSLLFCLLRLVGCIFGLVHQFELISFCCLSILLFQDESFHLPRFCVLLSILDIFILWLWGFQLLCRVSHNFERELSCRILFWRFNSFFTQLFLIVIVLYHWEQLFLLVVLLFFPWVHLVFLWLQIYHFVVFFTIRTSY